MTLETIARRAMSIRSANSPQMTTAEVNWDDWEIAEIVGRNGFTMADVEMAMQAILDAESRIDDHQVDCDVCGSTTDVRLTDAESRNGDYASQCWMCQSCRCEVKGETVEVSSDVDD